MQTRAGIDRTAHRVALRLSKARIRQLALAIVLMGAVAAADDSVMAWLRQVDGVVPGEAASGTEIEVDARRLGNVLLVDVRSPALRVASLCLSDGERVVVLHASEALGVRTFRRGEGGWQGRDRFEWSLRATGLGPEALSDRRSYYESHGWIANTVPMGEPGETEFVIGPDVLPSASRLGLGLMLADPEGEVVGWPAGIDGGCAEPGLVGGDDGDFDFEPSSWSPL